MNYSYKEKESKKFLDAYWANNILIARKFLLKGFEDEQ
jgi:hypothetical protein